MNKNINLNKKCVGTGPVFAHTSKARQNKGITLIALIITIIVMLILVSVTITMAINGGLFEKAGEAVGETQNAIDKEQTLADGKVTIDNKVYNSIDEYLIASGIKEEPVEIVPTTEDYVGCYADFDGVEGIDGIIYADLAVGNTKGEKWADNDGVYTIPVETGLKEYYVSGTADGPFGDDIQVIKAVPGTTGNDRFYVMALENVGSASTKYCWYNAAYGNMSDYATATSVDFSKGKENTTNMIAKWDKGSGEGGYGTQDDNGTYLDMWGQIKTQVANGWFVPSRAEWAAFANELGITSSNYSSFGLSDYYWSSSQRDAYDAWGAYFSDGFMDSNTVDYYYCVRLSATF